MAGKLDADTIFNSRILKAKPRDEWLAEYWNELKVSQPRLAWLKDLAIGTARVFVQHKRNGWKWFDRPPDLPKREVPEDTTMAGKLDNGLPLEAVAVSAYNAFARACGHEAPNFEHLGIEETANWGRLANRADAILTALEGKPIAVVAAEVCKFWSRETIDWDKLSATQKVPWEAVTRHLATLIDAEAIPDLQSLERSWGPWAEARMQKVTV